MITDEEYNDDENDDDDDDDETSCQIPPCIRRTTSVLEFNQHEAHRHSSPTLLPQPSFGVHCVSEFHNEASRGTSPILPFQPSLGITCVLEFHS